MAINPNNGIQGSSLNGPRVPNKEKPSGAMQLIKRIAQKVLDPKGSKASNLGRTVEGKVGKKLPNDPNSKLAAIIMGAGLEPKGSSTAETSPVSPGLRTQAGLEHKGSSTAETSRVPNRLQRREAVKKDLNNMVSPINEQKALKNDITRLEELEKKLFNSNNEDYAFEEVEELQTLRDKIDALRAEGERLMDKFVAKKDPENQGP